MVVNEDTPDREGSENEKKEPLGGGRGGERSIKGMLRDRCRSSRVKKTLRRRLPILGWLPEYDGEKFQSDLLAGLTVGLTTIPQGIAYAVVAGLEPQYGLYSGFMGCIAYFFLGSVKDITIGPTAIMSLMAQKSVEAYNSDFAVLLCFLSGCITTLFGVLSLGFLVNFISIPVTIGFTTASAITIASSQLKGLLGIQGKTGGFLESWISVVEHVNEVKYEDLSLGAATIAMLVLVKKLNDGFGKRFKNRIPSNRERILRETVKLVALARNAIGVIFGTVVAYIFFLYGKTPFRLTGEIKGEMPTFQPPPFSTTFENRTLSFTDMAAELGGGIITVPLISILETIAIAKAFAKGRTLDATQEMIALGAANILGSFVKSMPVAGSFTRTAVNNASGVRTPLGGLFTGALVLSALSLTSTFYFIPKATLAAVIFTAMFYMMEFHEFVSTWRTKRFDAVPMLCTLVGCLLLGLDYGILVGVCVNLGYILYMSARPVLTRETLSMSGRSFLVVRPEQSLCYPSAEYVRESIMKTCAGKGADTILAVDGRNVKSVDSTVAKNLRTLVGDLEKRQENFLFLNWPKSSVQTCVNLDNGLEKYFQDENALKQSG